MGHEWSERFVPSGDLTPLLWVDSGSVALSIPRRAFPNAELEFGRAMVE